MAHFAPFVAGNGDGGGGGGGYLDLAGGNKIVAEYTFAPDPSGMILVPLLQATGHCLARFIAVVDEDIYTEKEGFAWGIIALCDDGEEVIAGEFSLTQSPTIAICDGLTTATWLRAKLLAHEGEFGMIAPWIIPDENSIEMLVLGCDGEVLTGHITLYCSWTPISDGATITLAEGKNVRRIDSHWNDRVDRLRRSFERNRASIQRGNIRDNQ